MIGKVSIEDVEKGIRALSHESLSAMQASIESYLEEKLQDLSPDEKISLLEETAKHFDHAIQEKKTVQEFQSQELTRLVSLLIGRGIDASDLSSSELSGKLAQSLNIVFDMLNQIIGVINSALLGQNQEQETIRLIIGSQIGAKEGNSSLQSYLGQIQEAFLIAHKASVQAAEETIRQILSGLDPDAISASTGKGFKIWLLDDARCFGIYKEKFGSCKEWVESGRFSEVFLREFEKICQKLYKQK